MLEFELPYPQPNSAQPPKHDSHNGAHDEIRFGGEWRNASDDEFGDDQQPDQKEIDVIQRKGDSAEFEVRFHGDDQAHQKAHGDKKREQKRDPLPTEISVSNVAEEIEAEHRRKLDKQEGAQPDLEAAFLHFTAQGFEV